MSRTSWQRKSTIGVAYLLRAFSIIPGEISTPTICKGNRAGDNFPIRLSRILCPIYGVLSAGRSVAGCRSAFPDHGSKARPTGRQGCRRSPLPCSWQLSLPDKTIGKQAFEVCRLFEQSEHGRAGAGHRCIDGSLFIQRFFNPCNDWMFREYAFSKSFTINSFHSPTGLRMISFKEIAGAAGVTIE